MISTECSDEKGRQRQAARRSHKIRSCMNARRRASMDMTMDLKKHGRNLLPGLRAALARPSASSSHRRTCRPRRRNRLRLPEPCCCGDCQHPCPSPSRLSGLLGMRGALAGDAAAAAANYQNGLAVTALPSTGPALGFRKPGPSFRKHVKSSANSIIVGRRKCRGMLLHRHIGCFVRVGDRDVGGGVRRSVVGAWAAHPPALFR